MSKQCSRHRFDVPARQPQNDEIDSTVVQQGGIIELHWSSYAADWMKASASSILRSLFWTDNSPKPELSSAGDGGGDKGHPVPGVEEPGEAETPAPQRRRKGGRIKPPPQAMLQPTAAEPPPAPAAPAAESARAPPAVAETPRRRTAWSVSADRCSCFCPAARGQIHYVVPCALASWTSPCHV